VLARFESMDFGTGDSISPMGLMTILFETFFFGATMLSTLYDMFLIRKILGAYSSLFIFSTILL
jgi:hypothetical protein